MALITSPSNPRITKLKDLYTVRGRKQSRLFLMEGLHLLEELLKAQLLPHEVYYQPALLQRTTKGRLLLDRLLHIPGLSLIEVSERVIEALGDAQTSQGVVSVLPLDAFSPAQVRKRRPAALRPALLILDDLTDPGNVGTLLRTALAADVEAVLLTRNCVDCYNPKVVRSAAGAHLGLLCLGESGRARPGSACPGPPAAGPGTR